MQRRSTSPTSSRASRSRSASRMTELSGGQTRGAADRRRDDHLRHADRAARRGRKRRHQPLARAGAVARLPQDLHVRHPRSAHRAAVGLPHRAAGRPDRASSQHRRAASGSWRPRVAGSTTCSPICATGIRDGERIDNLETGGLRMKLAICAGTATTGKIRRAAPCRPAVAAPWPVGRLSEDRRAVRRGGRGVRARIRHPDAQSLFGRSLSRPLQCHGARRRAAMGGQVRRRGAAGGDRRPVPALFALCRRRSWHCRGRGDQRHEPAAQDRADAVAGRHRGGDQDRPRFAGRAGSVPRPHPRSGAAACGSARSTRSTASASTRSPTRSRRRRTSTAICRCAAIRRSAPARYASARRRSAGSRISGSCARSKTRRSTGANRA